MNMRVIIPPPIPQEVLEKVATDLAVKGRSDVLFVLLDGEVRVRSITDDQHCLTCQCNRVNAPSDPSHPLKRSWHG